MKSRILHEALCEWAKVPVTTPVRSPRTKGQALGELLPLALGKMGLEQRVQHQMIADAWPQIVGPAITKHAHPTHFNRGILTVSVNNSVWLHELSRCHKPMILEKIAKQFNPSPVKDIQFRIG